WLLPYAGCFGFLAGLTYPYYRFMNTTLAIVVLAGMGAWVAARFFLRRFRAAGVLGVVAILAGFGFIFASGLGPWTSQAPTARWAGNGSRAGLASVER